MWEINVELRYKQNCDINTELYGINRIVRYKLRINFILFMLWWKRASKQTKHKFLRDECDLCDGGVSWAFGGWVSEAQRATGFSAESEASVWCWTRRRTLLVKHRVQLRCAGKQVLVKLLLNHMQEQNWWIIQSVMNSTLSSMFFFNF